ncbi:MAG: VCBS repeat-containing protein [candidate division Zixibacteria bacterium]
MINNIMPVLVTIGFLFCGIAADVCSCDQLTFGISEQAFDTTITQTIAIGDLDHDGDLDAVFCNMAYCNSQVWLNDGKGFFTNSEQILTNLGHGVDLGDMDNDGDLDILISCGRYTDDNDVLHTAPSKVYINDGKANFHDSGQDFGDKDMAGNNAELHDIDNDGDLDAVIYYHKDKNKIYLNDGAAHFKDVEMTYPDNAFWGDLDRDNDVDIFVRQTGLGYITLLNDGNGNFVEKYELSDTMATGGRTLLVDVDSDGDLDALVSIAGKDNKSLVEIFLNNARGQFRKSEQVVSLEGRIINIVSNDFNNDNYPDLLISIMGQPYRLWMNNGFGGFVSCKEHFGQPVRFGKVVIGDLDNDSDLDIFIANYWWGVSEIWINQ